MCRGLVDVLFDVLSSGANAGTDIVLLTCEKHTGMTVEDLRRQLGQQYTSLCVWRRYPEYCEILLFDHVALY